jgi:hypothetical protein
MKAVTDTVAKLLKYPFGFHGDTGIRDYLYARLHVHGGKKLDVKAPKPEHSTILLQSEHYTLVKYKNTGKTGQGARFDIALTLTPKSPETIEDRFAENLDALFAFELGKNKALAKVIDPDMLDHESDAIPGTSDISKLYLELMNHDLRQGWAIEFYDSKAMNGASIISKALDICKCIELKDGKKLVAIFVGFSPDGEHYISSNDENVQLALIDNLIDSGIDAEPDLERYSQKRGLLNLGNGWDTFGEPSATVEEIFEDRADFANRIINSGAMKECGRASQYLNLEPAQKITVAQLHPHDNGIALVLRSINKNQPKTSFARVSVNVLKGCKGRNAAWLEGKGKMFEKKGPAIAFLIPDEVNELGDNSKEWQEIANLLNHAKTLV